jgi:hypothetical protein
MVRRPPGALEAIAGQPQLARLCFGQVPEAAGAQLEALLRSLQLLRLLELESAEGFTRACLEAVAALPLLHELRLNGAGRLRGAWLGQLRRCKRLETLGLEPTDVVGEVDLGELLQKPGLHRWGAAPARCWSGRTDEWLRDRPHALPYPRHSPALCGEPVPASSADGGCYPTRTRRAGWR